MRQQSTGHVVRAASVAVVLVMVAAAMGGTQGAAAAERTKSVAIGLGAGYRPPEFSAEDLSGTVQSLGDHTGNVVVLHFWATWCPYCRGEIGELTQLHMEWASKGVRVITISTDQDAGKLKQFLAKSPVPYPVIHDPSIADQYAISGIPVTYVIGRDGRIVQRLDGASDIIAAVTRALETPAA